MGNTATPHVRDTWKSLIGSNASLQYNCNKDGFNAVCDYPPSSKARIGIITTKTHAPLVTRESDFSLEDIEVNINK